MKRICHLCGALYEDDPFLAEQPSHTPQQCLDILQFRYFEAESRFRDIERQLVRAKLEYIQGEKKAHKPKK